MHIKICLFRICIPQAGLLILTGNNFLAVCVVYLMIFTMAVAGIANGKMRPCLLHNENRHQLCNVEFSGHGIGRCVRADGKFSHWQRFMILKEILSQILLILFPVLIIAAVGFSNTAIFKSQ